MPSGDAIPLMGTTLLQEYEDVLLHPGVFRRSRLNGHEREALLDIFLVRREWVRIYDGWRPNLPDEGDSHLIELAVAGSAQWIITRNLRDFSGMAKPNAPGHPLSLNVRRRRVSLSPHPIPRKESPHDATPLRPRLPRRHPLVPRGTTPGQPLRFASRSVKELDAE